MIRKYAGRDNELSTTGTDASGRSLSPDRVTRDVLARIPEALAQHSTAVYTERSRFAKSSTDCCRNWSANGQCYYADMSHVEVCTPVCLDPLDVAAHSIAMVQIADAARRRAQAAADESVNFSLSTSNADLLDPRISFGSHVSVSIEPDLYEDLFFASQRPSRLAFVASGLAAAIPFFGAGYLLPWKDRTTYSPSARAHHITCVSSATTTTAFGRGMLNSRREPHGIGFERLHMIGFDFCLLSGALLTSFLQCLLAAAEAKFCRLQLVEPVRSLRAWSWGLDVSTGRMPLRATLIDGRKLTLPEYLEELTTILLRMCESDLIGDDIAPRAKSLLPRVIELAQHAGRGAIVQCARHLTWAAKLLYLLNICDQTGAELGDATTRLADHDFTNTDPDRGAIWSLLEQGIVDPLVTADQVAAAWRHPPANTRDAVRGRILSMAGNAVADADWSFIELRESHEPWAPCVRIDLPSLDFAACEAVDSIVRRMTTVEDLVRELRGLRMANSRDPVTDYARNLSLPNSAPPGGPA